MIDCQVDNMLLRSGVDNSLRIEVLVSGTLSVHVGNVVGNAACPGVDVLKDGVKHGFKEIIGTMIDARRDTRLRTTRIPCHRSNN